MTKKVASYRRILKTSSITGGASIINILIGLLRTKALALLFGPAGIGLIGLYTGLMNAATTIASMGVGTIGTRQIAEAVGKEEHETLAIVRRAMYWGVLILATSGALVVWSFKEILAIQILGNVGHASVIGWLSLGVAFSVASASQGALLRGMRRIGDMAKLSVYGAVLNTTFGLGVLWQWGIDAIWAFIVIGPLVNFLLGHWYVSRLPKTIAYKVSAKEIQEQWKVFLRLGIPFMGAGLVQTIVQLWIRISISDELGLDAVGHFQAAYLISMQYIGFVLAAMGADYYPRLTATIHNKAVARRLVNEQTEIALLLSAPIFIAMMGLAPWIVHLLYSSVFTPAIDILRWQILGDVLKVASWPLGFVILAAGAGKTFFWTESTALFLMGWLIFNLLPNIGIQITGIAFLACYAYLLPLVYFFAWRRINFKWSSLVKKMLTMTFLMCLVVIYFSLYSPWGVYVSLVLSSCFGCFTLNRLLKMNNVNSLGAKLISKIRITKRQE